MAKKLSERSSVALCISLIFVVVICAVCLAKGNMPKAHVVRQWNNISLFEIYDQMPELNRANLNQFPPAVRTQRFAHAFLANDPENFWTDGYKSIHKNDPVSKGTMSDKIRTSYVLVLTNDPLDQDFLVITPPLARTAQL